MEMKQENIKTFANFEQNEVMKCFAGIMGALGGQVSEDKMEFLLFGGVVHLADKLGADLTPDEKKSVKIYRKWLFNYKNEDKNILKK